MASIVLYSNLSSSNTNGSIGGKTGSPKDDISCLQCHNATNGNNANISTIFDVSKLNLRWQNLPGSIG